jgi:hypothetical protein
MKLKFNSNVTVKGTVSFEEGKIYEIDNSLGSASMWIKRGVADEFSEEEEVVIKQVQEEVVIKQVQEEEEEEVIVDESLDVLDVLGGSEEVAIVEVKEENMKGKKLKKGN